MGAVIDTELIGDRQQQSVGGGDRLIQGQLFDERLGLGGVGLARARLAAIDEPDLVLRVAFAAEVRAIKVVDDWENAAADRDSGLVAMILRTLYPPDVRIAIVMDNFSPHLSTKVDTRVGDWAKANNVELAYVLTNASWLNRIEAQFHALRSFPDGTDHKSHEEQNSMIRRHIIWRNRNAQDKMLRDLVKRANVA